MAAEHGAGGDVVAPRVADALDVPYLDRALPASLARAAEESEPPGLLVGRFARAGTMLAGGAGDRVDRGAGQVRADLAEFLARASADGGVVLGRGGVVLLADSPAVLHVLLQGDHERRVERVAEREGISRAEAVARVRAHDRARKDYMRRSYGVDAGDRMLYHLVIDTVALGISASVDLIVAASRARIRQPPKES